MSRLDELIAELCPDGVEFCPLSMIAHYSTERMELSNVTVENYVGVENLLQNKQGKTNASSLPPSGSVIRFYKGDILLGNIRPYLKKIWLADHDGGTNGDVLTIQIDNRQTMMPDFLYYILSSEDFFAYDNQNAKGSKMPRGDKTAVMKYVIPVPPLPVQQEIVRMLDNFTALTAELTTELSARQKQYEYYRDNLLTFDSNIPIYKLGELCEIKGRIGFRGYTQIDFVTAGNGAISLSPGNIIANHLYFDDCKYITWEKYLESPEIMLSENDVVLCKTGSTVGKVAVVDYLPEKATLNPQLVVLKKIKCNHRYLFYQLSKLSIQARIKAIAGIGSVPNISQKNISEIEIPVPSIEKQNILVRLLDRFDALCNDITNGLPAEIAARQKQYEYYRDKLLTFKQAEVIE